MRGVLCTGVMCDAYRPLKLFLIELAMAWATQKDTVGLDPNYKLPKMRYKGSTIQPQQLRLDRGPVSPPVITLRHPVLHCMLYAPAQAAQYENSAAQQERSSALPGSWHNLQSSQPACDAHHVRFRAVRPDSQLRGCDLLVRRW